MNYKYTLIKKLTFIIKKKIKQKYKHTTKPNKLATPHYLA